LSEGKAETDPAAAGEFRMGVMFPDKSRHKFQVSIHWGSFLANTSLEKQRSIEKVFPVRNINEHLPKHKEIFKRRIND